MASDALSITEFESLVGGRVEGIYPIEEIRMEQKLTELQAVIEQQRQQSFEAYHQAIGALAVIQELLKDENVNTPQKSS